MKIRFILFVALALIYGYCGCKCHEFDPTGKINDLAPTIKVLGDDIVYTERQVIDLKTQQPVTIQLKMDIVCHKDDAANAAPRPLVIFFHGFNPIQYFKHGAESYKYYKQDTHGYLMLDFARKHHCVVAFVQYVTTTLKWDDFAIDFAKGGQCGNKDDIIPLIDTLEEKRNTYFSIAQGKDAIRFLKSRHTEYNIDINNITLVGFSAGGGIAAGAGFITDPAFRPAWSFTQPSITYNSTNKFPDQKLNLILTGIKLKPENYCNKISYLPPTFPNPIPRIDLGSIEGRNTSTYNSSVKNVALLCSGLPNLVSIKAGGPRLFVFGDDKDERLVPLLDQTKFSCSNKKPFSIFSEIITKAKAVGYQEGINLKVVPSYTKEHNYSIKGPLAGSYITVVDAIWAFIK
ncbi:MAG: hypothetical protein MUC87_12305 [Bacteroidia bacterium]|jgi:hypothetical protein|nr:hypothetical protein [Bacteroidia bacterium]